jgi:hypothetical protein
MEVALLNLMREYNFSPSLLQQVLSGPCTTLGLGNCLIDQPLIRTWQTSQLFQRKIRGHRPIRRTRPLSKHERCRHF